MGHKNNGRKLLDICADADLMEGQSIDSALNGWPILVCRSDGGFFAIIDRCTPGASPLGEGRVPQNAVSCPLHGARFDLASGKCGGGLITSQDTPGAPPRASFELTDSPGIPNVFGF